MNQLFRNWRSRLQSETGGKGVLDNGRGRPRMDGVRMIKIEGWLEPEDRGDTIAAERVGTRQEEDDRAETGKGYAP